MNNDSSMPLSPETTIKLSNFPPIVCQKSRQGSAGAKCLRDSSFPSYVVGWLAALGWQATMAITGEHQFSGSII
jgi:hypothetical protein